MRFSADSVLIALAVSTTVFHTFTRFYVEVVTTATVAHCVGPVRRLVLIELTQVAVIRLPDMRMMTRATRARVQKHTSKVYTRVHVILHIKTGAADNI